MARSSIPVTITPRVEEREPDGSACLICGEPCYLSKHVLIATVVLDSGGRNYRRIDEVPGTETCGSCVDVLRDSVETFFGKGE